MGTPEPEPEPTAAPHQSAAGLQAATALIHHPYQPPAGFEALPPGVFKASTVFFPNVAALRARQWKDKSGYTYGLHGTPTTFTLEERLATLEGGQHCLLCPSGLAALALVNLTFLQAGDEVLLPDNAYGPSKELALAELRAYGIGHRVYDPMQPADLAAQIGPATRLVWLEAPGSVTLEYPDLPALMQVLQAANDVRAGQGGGGSSGQAAAGQGSDRAAAATQANPAATRPRQILSALDNTWGAGIAFCGFDFGVDVVLQALTKYPSGGADVLMGSVVTRAAALHRQLLHTHMRLGLGVGANDAELVLRGLPTLHLRYRAQDASTRTLAHWLQGQRGVAQVLHPALPASPGHTHWQRDARGAACLLSLLWQPHIRPEQIDAFCDRLRLFRIGYSWGGPVSLCVPYDLPALRSRPSPLRPSPAQPQPPAHGPRLVRLAIGLEGVVDLQADLAQALEALD
jgi:cystathionine beta-lyase